MTMQRVMCALSFCFSFFVLLALAFCFFLDSPQCPRDKLHSLRFWRKVRYSVYTAEHALFFMKTSGAITNADSLTVNLPSGWLSEIVLIIMSWRLWLAARYVVHLYINMPIYDMYIESGFYSTVSLLQPWVRSHVQAHCSRRDTILSRICRAVALWSSPVNRFLKIYVLFLAMRTMLICYYFISSLNPKPWMFFMEIFYYGDILLRLIRKALRAEQISTLMSPWDQPCWFGGFRLMLCS